MVSFKAIFRKIWPFSEVYRNESSSIYRTLCNIIKYKCTQKANIRTGMYKLAQDISLYFIFLTLCTAKHFEIYIFWEHHNIILALNYPCIFHDVKIYKQFPKRKLFSMYFLWKLIVLLAEIVCRWNIGSGVIFHILWAGVSRWFRRSAPNGWNASVQHFIHNYFQFFHSSGRFFLPKKAKSIAWFYIPREYLRFPWNGALP